MHTEATPRYRSLKDTVQARTLAYYRVLLLHYYVQNLNPQASVENIIK